MAVKILFYVGHPAHYHNLRNLVSSLEVFGYSVLFVVRPKDVLIDLMERSAFEFVSLPEKSGNGVLSILRDLLIRFRFVNKVAKQYDIQLMVGTDPSITHVGRWRRIRSIVINEDDAEAVPKFAKLTYPFADRILVPTGCSTGRYEWKTIRYSGYHELAYLAPKYYSPDLSKLLRIGLDAREYVVLRFSSLNAHHDVGVGGVDDAFALEIVERLRNRYEVVITSERPLSSELEPYRQSFPAELMHDVLAYAKMIIGDSQTMAAEAMVLGTPSIRCNDFVGRLSYLEELENTYELGFGVLPKDKDQIPDLMMRLLGNQSLEAEWHQKNLTMLKDKIDVVEFWTEEILKTLAE